MIQISRSRGELYERKRQRTREKARGKEETGKDWHKSSSPRRKTEDGVRPSSDPGKPAALAWTVFNYFPGSDQRTAWKKERKKKKRKKEVRRGGKDHDSTRCAH